MAETEASEVLQSVVSEHMTSARSVDTSVPPHKGRSYISYQEKVKEEEVSSALNNTGMNFRILFFAFRRQLGSQDLPKQDLTVPVSCTSQTSSNLRC